MSVVSPETRVIPFDPTLPSRLNDAKTNLPEGKDGLWLGYARIADGLEHGEVVTLDPLKDEFEQLGMTPKISSAVAVGGIDERAKVVGRIAEGDLSELFETVFDGKPGAREIVDSTVAHFKSGSVVFEPFPGMRPDSI